MAKDIHDYDSDDQILFSVLGRPNFYELHVSNDKQFVRTIP